MSGTSSEHNMENILDQIDEARRDAMRKILTAGFATPTIASFSVATLFTKNFFGVQGSNIGIS